MRKSDIERFEEARKSLIKAGEAVHEARMYAPELCIDKAHEALYFLYHNVRRLYEAEA